MKHNRLVVTFSVIVVTLMLIMLIREADRAMAILLLLLILPMGLLSFWISKQASKTGLKEDNDK